METWRCTTHPYTAWNRQDKILHRMQVESSTFERFFSSHAGWLISAYKSIFRQPDKYNCICFKFHRYLVSKRDSLLLEALRANLSRPRMTYLFLLNLVFCSIVQEVEIFQFCCSLDQGKVCAAHGRFALGSIGIKWKMEISISKFCEKISVGLLEPKLISNHFRAIDERGLVDYIFLLFCNIYDSSK